MDDARTALAAFELEYASLRSSAEKALAQLEPEELRRAPDADTNSVAVLMKHVGGNLRSRFKGFLDTDGEKAWRRRDDEFVDDFPPGEAGRAAAHAAWDAGWRCVAETLASLRDEDLGRVVSTRGEPHSVARALTRSLAHTAVHCGQIVLVARLVAGPGRWSTLSIPRGGSAAHNRAMGHGAADGTAAP
ncbi:MAG: hypothetical protein RL112_351 [Planctomycetota bacterium]|jgi:hypothetical protein